MLQLEQLRSVKHECHGLSFIIYSQLFYDAVTVLKFLPNV